MATSQPSLPLCRPILFCAVMRLGGLAGSLTLAVLVLLSGASASEPKSGAYQWGGVLGNATQRSSTPIPVLGDVPFATVALAETFLCGLVANGTAQCVSGNATQLGSGSENAVGSATPVPVSGGHAYTALAASQWASLVCAIRADDASLECWGGAPCHSGPCPSAAAVGHACR